MPFLLITAYYTKLVNGKYYLAFDFIMAYRAHTALAVVSLGVY